jgi:hypothetical protein
VATLAWIGLFGAAVFSYLAGVFIDIRIRSDAFNASSVDEFIQSAKSLLDGAVIVDIITSGMIVIGALALATTILRIENRRAAREREIDEAVNRA